MSYLMTHFIIANEFAKRRKVHNTNLFILGSLSPDSVHARADFAYEMKSASHLHPKDIPWGNVHTREAMDSWYGDVGQWYKEKMELVQNQEEKDYLDGYFLHILVDLFNCKLLYGKNLLRYSCNAEVMRPIYRQQCIFQDNYLFQDYENAQPMLEELKKLATEDRVDQILKDLDLADIFSKENVADSIDHNLTGYMAAAPVDWAEIEQSADPMISEQSTWDYVNIVTAEAERLLYTFPEIGDTFVIEQPKVLIGK